MNREIAEVSETPEKYSRLQVYLHWFVVLGIISQIAVHEQIVRVTSAERLGQPPVSSDVIFANMHITIGSLIMIAVLARLWLRIRRGVPAHPPTMKPLQARLSSIVHTTFYVLLLAMGVTGIITKNHIFDLGTVHFGINITIFFLALGHAAAALYNHFVRKDGTLSRMNPRA